MIDKLNELCMWLSHQKGMMSQDYAKELAKIIVKLKQTKPLSDEEIYELWCEADNTELLPEMRLNDGSINYIITTFAKLIEERHGIK